MFLVQAGGAAVPLLHAGLEQRDALPMVLRVLGDIADERSRPDIARFAGHLDREVAEAARDALTNLDAAPATEPPG